MREEVRDSRPFQGRCERERLYGDMSQEAERGRTL